MSKATAKKAIDFNRLFALKDKLASKAAEPGDGNAFELDEGEPVVPSKPPPSVEPTEPKGEGRVLDFPTAPSPVADAPPAPHTPPPVVPPMAAVTKLLPSTPEGEPSLGEGEPEGTLRIGMSRALHHRVRAAAAMACTPPVSFVRDLLEAAAPRFDSAAPLAELAQFARGVLPQADSRQHSIEVRMQVRVSENLHQRLVQLAALRAQTLGACLIDALQHHLPR